MRAISIKLLYKYHITNVASIKIFTIIKSMIIIRRTVMIVVYTCTELRNDQLCHIFMSDYGGVSVHMSASRGSRSASIPSRTSRTCSRCAPRPGSASRSSRLPFWRCLPCSASPGNSRSRRFRPSGWSCWARMSTDCCWPRPGCSSAGRPSTTWWSGRAASRASR